MLMKKPRSRAARFFTGAAPAAVLAALVLAFLFAAPFLPAAPSAPESPVLLRAPEELFPGDAAALFLEGGGEIVEAAAELRDGAGRTAVVFSAFPLPGRDAPDAAASPGGEWAAVGGVPSTLPPGNYVFLVRYRTGGGTGSVEAPVGIVSRDFILEDIPLSIAMSELRTEQDPRKDEEARELYRLLGRFDPAAVYHAEAFRRPVGDFRETSFFGDRRTYLYADGGRARAVHQGIDYATPRGTPVAAAGAGRVVMAKERIMSGFTVVLEHLPGVYSLYYHLDGIQVEEGRIVAAGDTIGVSGATGLVTGPHLHWEVRAAGVAVEPKKLLGRGLLDKNGLFSMIREDLEKGR